MGEISELMLTGVLCCQCGQTLDEKVIDMEMGVPIICSDCYEELSVKEKEDYEYRNERTN